MHGLTRTLRSLTKKLTALHPITKPKMKKKKKNIYILITILEATAHLVTSLLLAQSIALSTFCIEIC